MANEEEGTGPASLAVEGTPVAVPVGDLSPPPPPEDPVPDGDPTPLPSVEETERLSLDEATDLILVCLGKRRMELRRGGQLGCFVGIVGVALMMSLLEAGHLKALPALLAIPVVALAFPLLGRFLFGVRHAMGGLFVITRLIDQTRWPRPNVEAAFDAYEKRAQRQERQEGKILRAPDLDEETLRRVVRNRLKSGRSINVLPSKRVHRQRNLSPFEGDTGFGSGSKRRARQAKARKKKKRR